ncbi:MAG: hypothetical protein R3E79_02915 [Caldilineaceae bacterium]
MIIIKCANISVPGVRQVWVISPEHRTLFLYDGPNDLVLLSEERELVNEELLPGFRCKVSELFQQPANAASTAAASVDTNRVTENIKQSTKN